MKNGRNWLKDDLPADLPGARIFVYEYNSYPEKSDQKQRLVKEALQLLNLIDSRRDDQPVSESSVRGGEGRDRDADLSSRDDLLDRSFSLRTI